MNHAEQRIQAENGEETMKAKVESFYDDSDWTRELVRNRLDEIGPDRLIALLPSTEYSRYELWYWDTDDH